MNQKKTIICIKPCEYLTLAGTCSRTPCPYGRQLSYGELVLQKRDNAKKIKLLMYKYDFTKEQLCKNAHISMKILKSILNEEILIPESIEDKLCECFHITKDSFNYKNPIKYTQKPTIKKKDYRDILPFIFPQ
ncbi:MAG: hypothetical protein K5917_00505 [Clostridiales bacterium]|nr:hypothetical protein [Clostridiales bacterium]